MLKKIFFAGMILLAASCSNESELNEVINPEKATAPVTVRVNGFSITQENFPTGGTRAEQDVVDYTGVQVLTLAFYDGSTEVYKTTQKRFESSTYTTFGEFTCNLPIGAYTMVVIGNDYQSEGDENVLTSSTVAGYTGERARETFCATQSVTVTAAGVDISVTMNRINALLNIVSTDSRPAEVKKVKTTYSKGSKGFNPMTGLASDDNGFSVTNTPSNTGTINVGSNVFLASDEEAMTITIEALDADNNVLFTKVVPNVSLKRNRKTILSGAIFTANASSATFQVETDWLESNTVNF